MYLTSVARRTGRGVVVLAFSLAAVSLSLPGTAYARHNDGAAYYAPAPYYGPQYYGPQYYYSGY